MDTTKLLPVGSVVKLKEATKKLFVAGIAQESAEKKYDYIGMLYPEGFISDEYTFLFNHGDIAEIVFVGFVDAEHQVFRSNLNKLLNEGKAEED